MRIRTPSPGVRRRPVTGRARACSCYSVNRCSSSEGLAVPFFAEPVLFISVSTVPGVQAVLLKSQRSPRLPVLCACSGVIMGGRRMTEIIFSEALVMMVKAFRLRVAGCKWDDGSVSYSMNFVLNNVQICYQV